MSRIEIEKAKEGIAVKMKKRTLCIDFDGVIAQYDTWKGKGKFGDPVPGVKKFLTDLIMESWIIIIHTTRSEEYAIRDYLEKHEIPFHYFNQNPENFLLDCSSKKPLADVYLDDRALRFSGDFEKTYFDVMNFKPWYKKDRE